MSQKLKKIVDDHRDSNNTEVDMVDRGIVNIQEISGLRTLGHLTRLTLSHNRITAVPSTIVNLTNLEILNFFNNCIGELPTSISSLGKLKILNLGMNKLATLPRGFGAFPALEVLDLTYNNLSENSLPGNFFCLAGYFVQFTFDGGYLQQPEFPAASIWTCPDTLRALYLGDNDFEYFSPEIGKLKNLQILCLRENDLVVLPKEIGDLLRLRELHVQGNRLTVLPPELGALDFVGMKQVFKGENNPWVLPIADQFQVGVSHVFDYIRSETYNFLHGRHMTAGAALPPKNPDKSKKISRKV